MAKQKTKSELFYEKLSPIFGYLILVFIIVTSIFTPYIAAVVIIFINVYFLYKSITFFFQFVLGLYKIRVTEQIDWVKKLEGLDNITAEISQLENEMAKVATMTYKNSTNKKLPKTYSSYKIFNNFGIFKRFAFYFGKRKSIRFLKKELKFLEKNKDKNFISYKDLHHIVIIPHVKEPESILRETLNYLKTQTFPTRQITVVLAAEARDPQGVEISNKLKVEFEGTFENIWVTAHILGEDEAVGKSANMAWAGKKAAENVAALGWDFKKTTITSCDADSKLDPNYLACMSYKYITIKDYEYKYYTGAMVFYNNIWRLKFYARVKNSLSSVYNVGKLIRTDKLVCFSTYTASLWLIDQIGYWTPWVTPEDFHMFFKALFKFNDKVETIPIFLITMSDAAEGSTHWETIMNNYKQSRRWSWGISDDGWMIQNLVKNWNKYSLKAKYIALHVLFDHSTGPIIGLLILIGGNIPPLLNDSFNRISLGASLPSISSTIIKVTAIFMALVIFFDFFLKPKRKDNSVFKLIISVLEWPTMTFSSLFLTILPGLEAHTRLIFGRYLEYYVTIKKGDEEEKKS